jgi:hemerythrin-like domain-containing protein
MGTLPYVRSEIRVKSTEMLSAEHRLIERVLRMMTEERDRIYVNNETDIITVERGLDFLESYGRLTHRAKEESIVLPTLRDKDLSHEESVLLKEVAANHAAIEGAMTDLASARDAYIRQESGTPEMIRYKLDNLIGLYHKHFKMEEERLFPLIEERLSDEEEREMVERFHQLNRDRIHEMFEVIAGQIEERQAEMGR